MAGKTILSRIVQKHDTEAKWVQKTDFIPNQGEIIVYDIDENYGYERFKIGDGVTNINELPFTSATPDWSINDPNAAGYIENRTHWIGTAEAPLILDDITGREVFDIGESAFLVKMSDVPKTAEELIGSTLIVKLIPAEYNDYSGPILEVVLKEDDVIKQDITDTVSMVFVGLLYSTGNDPIYVVSVQGDGSDMGLPPEGMYFSWIDQDNHTYSLSCLTGPQEVVHKLDKKYLPDFVSTVNGQTPDVNGNIDVTVPTKTSDLTNDSGFITVNDIPDVTVPTKTSELTNDSGFITVDDVPTKTSELTNDSGFITTSDIPVPSKITDGIVSVEVGSNGTRIGGYAVSITSDSTINIGSSGNAAPLTLAGNVVVDGDSTISIPEPTEDTHAATKSYVDTSVAGLVDSAPETLNTLKELSTALGNDENFATTVANQIGTVANKIPTKVSTLTNDSGYQTSDQVTSAISSASISTSQLTNGDSVDKLYLDGKFHIGSASSNKTFRLPADAITIEYSNDGGSTWTNYGNTAAQKEMLFDESQGYTWYLGKKTDKTQTTNDMLRVTISNVTDRYIGVKQVYHYASYNGQGLVFDLEYSTLSAPTTFVKVISDGRLRGWYGHNMYNFNQRTIGASNATTSAIRLTYKMNEINNSYASSSIKDIRFFGDNVWTAPADSYIGNMLKLNTPYKFTDDNTIDFPGTVDVNALKVNGTDISETYATKAEVEALVAKIEELMASI